MCISWQHSCHPCTKLCNDLLVIFGIIAKTFLHQISLKLEKLPMEWSSSISIRPGTTAIWMVTFEFIIAGDVCQCHWIIWFWKNCQLYNNFVIQRFINSHCHDTIFLVSSWLKCHNTIIDILQQPNQIPLLWFVFWFKFHCAFLTVQLTLIQH